MLTYVNFEKMSHFLTILFWRENINSSKYKRKRKIFPFLIFLFSLIVFFSFFNPKPRILFKHQIISVKHGLRSSSTKFVEPSPSKSSKPLLGGDESIFIEEQWTIPPFFENYLFDKSLDWDLAPCSERPSLHGMWGTR